MIELSTPIVTKNEFSNNKFENIDAKTLDDDNLKKVCDDFESFLLNS